MAIRSGLPRLGSIDRRLGSSTALDVDAAVSWQANPPVEIRLWEHKDTTRGGRLRNKKVHDGSREEQRKAG